MTKKLKNTLPSQRLNRVQSAHLLFIPCWGCCRVLIVGSLSFGWGTSMLTWSMTGWPGSVWLWGRAPSIRIWAVFYCWTSVFIMGCPCSNIRVPIWPFGFTQGFSAMIDFVVASLNLWLQVLDIWFKTGQTCQTISTWWCVGSDCGGGGGGPARPNLVDQSIMWWAGGNA